MKKPRIYGIIFLIFVKFVDCQYVTPQYAEIRAVSAMCSSDGITASIDFDKPFTGKIYSLNYANVDDCLYYNSIDRDTVLFSIPAALCGTKLQRTTRNMIDQMENRVYVQMDKQTQTSADKQFSFVCRLSDPQKNAPVPGVPTKDSPAELKDSYVGAPIRPVASSMTTKMMDSVMPIKPSEVQQVSAFSRDAHLGNWPIPGSKPYDPSMKPVSTYPFAPPILPEVVKSHPTTISSPTMVAAARDMNAYATRPISGIGLGDVGTHAPPPTPPPLPLFPALVPQRSPAIARVFTTNPPSPTTTMPPPIIPNVHFKQGVGVPLMPGIMHTTKVDASQWSDPNAYATPPQPQTHSAFQNPTTSMENLQHVDSTTPHPSKDSKSYKEQPLSPTADAPFSSDRFNTNHITDIPHEPTTSVLKTTQDTVDIEPEVTLEIQRGEGPFAPPVTTPIKIGDNISLVVKAKSYLNESSEFDMFVHSCFATDGKGDVKVQIIDENGCVIRREFASELHRAKDHDLMMFYYVMIKAFKFPGPDDVYFSCTIEFTPKMKAPNICSKLRRRREIFEAGATEMRLFDSVNVELEDDREIRATKSLHQHSTSEDECLSEQYLYIIVIFVLLITVTISLVSNLYQFVRNQRKS